MRGVLPESRVEGHRPRLGEVPTPEPGPGEVLIEVVAAGLNRADLLQLRGLYPPPRGESFVPGLEVSGRILQCGEGASRFAPGQRVMALLAGGGHAELAAVPEGQVMPLPDSFSFIEGAGLPEACLTAWTNLVVEGGLSADQTVLITGAASGIGTVAVQIARELGATVLVAGRSSERLERLKPLGASRTFKLLDGWSREVRDFTAGRGVDLVLDLVGGDVLRESLATLRTEGRLVLVGLMAGQKAELDLPSIMGRRLRIIGSVLRSRSKAEKAVLVESFSGFGLPRLADRRLVPVIDHSTPFDQVSEAYAALEAGGIFGKVILEIGDPDGPSGKDR